MCPYAKDPYAACQVELRSLPPSNQPREEAPVVSAYFSWPARLLAVNTPDARFVRHRLFEAFLDPDLSRKPDWKDSNFWLVPGLFDKRHYSLRGVVPSDKFYLRHQNRRVKLQEFIPGDTQFAKDATFEITPPLATGELETGGLSLRSYNFPNLYLRHRNFEMWVEEFQDNDAYRKDATFRLRNSALQP